MTKLKVFADDKLSIAKLTISLYDRVENTVRKQEKMLVTSIFSFSHSVFQSPIFRVVLCGTDLNSPCRPFSPLIDIRRHYVCTVCIPAVVKSTMLPSNCCVTAFSACLFLLAGLMDESSQSVCREKKNIYIYRYMRRGLAKGRLLLLFDALH